MLTIKNIEPAGPDKRACRLFFEGAEPQESVVAQAVVKELAFVPATTFASWTDFHERVAAAEPELALARCLRILKARDKTSFELSERLQRDGYSGQTIKKTIAQLKKTGLVDDERFARNYLEWGLSAKKGWTRLVRELAQKGIEIDPDDERYRPDPEEEYQRASALVERLPVDTEKERARVLRRLITRGYPYPLARRVLDARKSML